MPERVSTAKSGRNPILARRQKPLGRPKRPVKQSGAAIPAPQPADRVPRAPNGPPPHLERQPKAASASSAFAGVAPASSYFYFDAVTIHCMVRLSENQKAKLRADCGNLHISEHGDWLPDGRGGWWQLNIYPYAERYHATQPGAYFLKFFARRNDVRLTYAEIAADLTFDNKEGSYRIFQIFQRHLIQPCQHKFRAIEIFINDGGQGISTSSKRKGGHYFSGYNSLECRIDGVTDCWHFEGRHKSKASLARISLNHPRDLLKFDHEKYWVEWEKRGHLLAIDLERLGREYSNKLLKTRRKHSEPTPYGTWRSDDHRTGAWLFRKYGCDKKKNATIQQFLRTYGRGPYVMKLSYLSAFGII